jgi:hypothetical protein
MEKWKYGSVEVLVFFQLLNMLNACVSRYALRVPLRMVFQY